VVHNAHPHFSHGTGAAADTPGRVALVHNGIIENHDELRAALQARGYVFQSQTDTEVIAHLIDSLYNGDIFDALKHATAQLRGARLSMARLVKQLEDAGVGTVSSATSPRRRRRAARWPCCCCALALLAPPKRRARAGSGGAVTSGDAAPYRESHVAPASPPYSPKSPSGCCAKPSASS
jgi:hypothetical protein